MRSPEQIEHKGVVRFVEKGVVRVAIEVNEACGSCASRKACAMGSSEQREIVICTDKYSSYTVGEEVTVGARRTTGIMAVVLCYVVPLVVLGAAVGAASAAGLSEALVALCSLLLTALYFALLAWQHKNIARKVTFTIEKR